MIESGSADSRPLSKLTGDVVELVERLHAVVADLEARRPLVGLLQVHEDELQGGNSIGKKILPKNQPKILPRVLPIPWPKSIRKRNPFIAVIHVSFPKLIFVKILDMIFGRIFFISIESAPRP